MSWVKVAQVHNADCAVFNPESKKLMVRRNSLEKPTARQVDEIAIQILKKFCEGVRELEGLKGWKRVFQFKDHELAIFNGKSIKKQNCHSPKLKKISRKEEEKIINFILSYSNI